MKPEDVKDLDGAADKATGQMQDLRKAVDDLLKQAALDAAQASKQKDIFFMADMLDGIKGLFEEVYNTIAPQWIEALKAAQLPGLAKLSEKEIKDLTPYLFTALADYCRRNYIDDENLTISEIAGQTDPETGKTVIELAISEAREALAGTAKLAIQTKAVRSIDFPLDPFSRIWNVQNLPGDRLSVFDNLRVNPEGKGKDINLYFAIDPTGVNCLLEGFDLTPTQRRYIVAMDALAQSGNYNVTVGQIYRLAGEKGRPNNREKKDFDKFINICFSQISANNKAEVDAKYNKTYTEYKGALYPLEVINERAIINGQLVESYIHLFRDAPLLSLARERGQVTTFPPEVLQLPEGMKHTKHTDNIVEYLLYRIAHAKNGTGNRRILWKSIFEYTHIESKRTQYNKMKDIMKIMSEWKKIGFIEGAHDDGLAVTVTFKKKKQKE